MNDTFLKLLATLPIVTIWMVFTIGAAISCHKIWEIREIDNKASIAYFKQSMLEWIPNPFSKMAQGLRPKTRPNVSFIFKPGFTFTARGPDTINSKALEDRKQYLLSISNPTNDTIKNISWRFQFPYPIEYHETLQQKQCVEVRFSPLLPIMTFEGSGSVTTLRQPMTSSYELSILELQPHGVLELLITLNSWRDPRGKHIPPEDLPRYDPPEVGPIFTYIYGHYNTTVGNANLINDFYAPFSLDNNKTVILENPTKPPPKLARIVSFE